MPKSGTASRIIYIESKAEGLNGPTRIGRVTFSKTRKRLYYNGHSFSRVSGFKLTTAARILGRNIGFLARSVTARTLFMFSNTPAKINEDVREEYCTKIRKRPERRSKTST